MAEVIVATPLKYSAITHPYTFANGISIRELSPILWDISIVKGLISARERADLEGTSFWLCASADYENVYGSTGDELYDAARHAALALQIICPTGAKHVFLKFQASKDGQDNAGSNHPKLLRSSFLGRITDLEEQGLEQFDNICAGITRASSQKVVRLQNPVLLLGASAAENHSAKFIAEAVGRFRILLVAETLSEVEQLLLFSLLCVDAVLDQLQQHAILTQLSTLAMLLTCFASLGGRLTLWRTAFSASFMTPLCTNMVYAAVRRPLLPMASRASRNSPTGQGRVYDEVSRAELCSSLGW